MKVIKKILFFKDQIEKLEKKEGNMQCGLGVLKHFLYCSDGWFGFMYQKSFVLK